ncbi:MAG: lysylphosphatidylglycerol synthase transmembrane domain-containing protein [Chloroflexota bacterium]|jgi:uncharacterized membrane protein YbhN (UPF0104 family)
MHQAATASRPIQLAIILIVIILLLFLLWLVDWDTLLFLVRQSNWHQIALATPFLLLSFLLLLFGWRQLLPGKPGRGETFNATAISFALSIVTPVPDSLLRIVTTEQVTGTSLTQATASLVVERFLAAVVRLLAFIAFVAIWTWERSDSSGTRVAGLGLIIAALAALVWILRHPQRATIIVARLRSISYPGSARVEAAATEFGRSLAQILTVRRFLALFALFLLIWLSAGIYHFIVLNAIPLTLAPGTMVAISLALLVVLPPTSPTIVGVYQTVAVGVLVTLGLLDGGTATGYALLVQLPQVILWLLLGAWGYRRSQLSLSRLAEEIRSAAKSRGSSQATAT